MQTIAAFEAKTHFSKLLAQVEQGEEITITKHGQVVAKIVPVHSTEGLSKAEAIRRLQSFGKNNFRLDGLDWKALRDEGRR